MRTCNRAVSLLAVTTTATLSALSLSACGSGSGTSGVASFVKPRPCSDASVGQILFQETGDTFHQAMRDAVDENDAPKADEITITLAGFDLKENIDVGTDGNITLCQAKYVAKIDVEAPQTVFTMKPQRSPAWGPEVDELIGEDPTIQAALANCKEGDPYASSCLFRAELHEKRKVATGIHKISGGLGQYGVGAAENGDRLFYRVSGSMWIRPEDVFPEVVERTVSCTVGAQPVPCPSGAETLFQ